MKLKKKNIIQRAVWSNTSRGQEIHVNRLNFDVKIRETVILMAEKTCIRSFDIDIQKGTLIIKINSITFTGVHIIKLKRSTKKITVVKRKIQRGKN